LKKRIIWIIWFCV